MLLSIVMMVIFVRVEVGGSIITMKSINVSKIIYIQRELISNFSVWTGKKNKYLDTIGSLLFEIFCAITAYFE